MSEETKKEETKKEIKESSEQIKSEAKSTFKDAKESIKNVNFKNDAKITSGYVTGLFKKPLATLHEIAQDSKNSKFKYALILVIIWLIVVFLRSIFGVHWSFKYVGFNFLTVIKDLLGPILGIIALSGTIFLMQKGTKKKSLTTVITTVTTAVSPLILANILMLLTLFSSDILRILSPIKSFATVLTAVFVFFGSKDLIGEDESAKFVNKFIVIQAIYFVIYFLLTFLGISIPMV